MNFQDILNVVMAEAVVLKLPVIVALIALDLVFGLLAALRRGELRLPKVGDFLLTNVIPFVGGYLALAIFAKYVALSDLDYTVLGVNFAGLISALADPWAFIVIVISLGSSIIRNMAEVYTGTVVGDILPVLDSTIGDGGYEPTEEALAEFDTLIQSLERLLQYRSTPKEPEPPQPEQITPYDDSTGNL